MGDIENNNNVLYNYEDLSKQEITPHVMENYRQCKQSKRMELETEIDNYTNIISFIFDYNYITGLKIIKENSYIERMMQPIMMCEETKNHMQELINISNVYIDNRLKG
ncbi:hypothetical protein D3C73_1370450 [compost metagenome]